MWVAFPLDLEYPPTASCGPHSANGRVPLSLPADDNFPTLVPKQLFDVAQCRGHLRFALYVTVAEDDDGPAHRALRGRRVGARRARVR